MNIYEKVFMVFGVLKYLQWAGTLLMVMQVHPSRRSRLNFKVNFSDHLLWIMPMYFAVEVFL